VKPSDSVLEQITKTNSDKIVVLIVNPVGTIFNTGLVYRSN
jgi:hypothetical protein